jgi:general secretion pathway protein J
MRLHRIPCIVPGGSGPGQVKRAYMRYPTPRQRGLTLLELLIAITLLTLLLTILFGGLFLANRSWDAGTARADRGDEVRLVSQVLRRMLRQIVPVVAQDQTGAHLTFRGEAQSLTFTAPLPAQLGPGGLDEISIEFAPQQRDLDLRMSYRLYRPDTSGTDQRSESRILVEHVTQGRFSYFGSLDGQQAPTWTDRWESPLRIPQLIRVEIATADGEWPDLTTEIKNNVYSAFVSVFPGRGIAPRF